MPRIGHLIRVAGAFAVAVSLAPAAQAVEQAGVAAAVVGDVTVTGDPRDQQKIDAQSGMDMLRFDRVVTESNARMQILLLDETNFSVGPQSEIVIDEFVYDPEKGVGEVSAEFVEGVFRYVSGRIGKVAPENVSVRTPAGTIGIRGTALFGAKDEERGAYFIGLLGPGSANNASLNRGGFVFSNEHGSTQVLRSGYGIYAKPGEAPGEPMPIPRELLNRLQIAFQGTPDATHAAPGESAEAASEITDAAQQAGQLTAASQALSQALASWEESQDSYQAQQTEAVEEGASRAPEDIPEMVAEMMGDTGNGNVIVEAEMLAQLSWGAASDLDLHVTGPQAAGQGRFHIYYANPGALDTEPFTELDDDFIGQNGSEVAKIGQFNTGGPYRISAFNFGDQSSSSTSLADSSQAVMELFSQGAIQRGPGGSVVVNGDLLEQITPPSGQAGNTWVGYEIDPATQTINVINQITSVSGSTAVQ